MSECAKYFNGLSLTEPYKQVGMGNPLVTQRFGADPWVLPYNGRVYVYTTGDLLEYDKDGNLKDNTYVDIGTINVISSTDLVNWTDHGWIHAAGKNGAAGKWAGNSWAPAVAVKKIDGKDKFFLYFADSARGIGVLCGDSPLGPFVDPLGHAMINHSSPNCAGITWLFDPAVLVDDDGKAYIYFGGGVPEGMASDPGTIRVAELGEDMISLASAPVAINAPYLFEDSGINKINGKYYFSYCTNFDVDEAGGKTFGIANGEIAYMLSKKPLGLFEYQGSICKNPQYFFGSGGNNHHCIFEHKGQYYIAYHAFLLQDRMGIKGGYRATHIDKVTINADGSIQPVTYTEKGVDAIGTLNPLETVKAVTIGCSAGISAEQSDKGMVVSDITSGGWLMVYGADFGSVNATKFTASVCPPAGGKPLGAIQIKANDEAVGYLEIRQGAGAGDSGFTKLTVDLIKPVGGVKDITLVFYSEGEGLKLDWWKFE